MEIDSYDFIIIGSGAASVCAALKMKQAGRSALIIEKGPHFGGSTSLSGGQIWIPGNSVMREAGEPDSREQARSYLDACAGPLSKGSSDARREQFLTSGPEAVDFLREQGMKFAYVDGYSDYHETEYPGGLARGRAIVAKIFDVRDLGMKQGMVDYKEEFLPMMMMECAELTLFGRTLKSWSMMLKIGSRVARNKLFGRRLVGVGHALQGRLLQIAIRNDLPIWLNAQVTGFTTENGAVTGVEVQRDGKTISVKSRLGVLINSGGFARNQSMRNEYLPQPSKTEWSVSNPGDTGEVQKAAMSLGADVEGMDLCWWIPGTLPPEGGANVFVFEHARPHSIIVDQGGSRFVNEGTSYVKIGLTTYERNKVVSTVPSWIIFDSRHRKKYTFGQALPGRTPKHWLTSGFMKKADTVAKLASLCNLPADALQATIDRFNGFARRGVDEDFHRGDSAYARYLGDPTNKPNPCLGTIEKGPFYAVQYFPRDVGTCGGLVTDEFARVLRSDGTVISGLYACGNSTSSVHGPSYPGPGASIGASLTFGYVAAKHASRGNSVP
jgi:3-oxosteroid 1-dehydrogenase